MTKSGTTAPPVPTAEATAALSAGWSARRRSRRNHITELEAATQVTVEALVAVGAVSEAERSCGAHRPRDQGPIDAYWRLAHDRGHADPTPSSASAAGAEPR